jgi:hypothetical protein
MPWDDTTPGPTDMSFLLEKPAGGKGFIRNEGGHFVTGDGARWRMWAMNICTDSPLPPLEYAPVVARHLAKYGVNCLRLHAMDHRWPKGILMRAQRSSPNNRYWGNQDETTRALDPEGLARLDYFIHCCKKEGIYLDLNLNVARTFTGADGVAQAEQVRWGKGLTYFDRQLIALQKEFAQQLIDHVNPFTGLRYGDEPAIALVELVNENTLIEFWGRGMLDGGEPEVARGHWYPIPSTYVAQLDRLWNAYVAERYRDRAALATAWEGDLRDYEDPARGSLRRLKASEFAAASGPRFREEARFYTDIEIAYFQEMKAYLRDELHVQQLLLGTSDYHHNWSGVPMLQSNATLEIMDGHLYWQHPRSKRPGYPWRQDDWFIENTPMVDQPDASLVARCARSKVQGLPYIVSEINEPFPNDTAAEFVPIAAAYGLLQDWDGIIFYDYLGGWGPPYWQDEEWRKPPRAQTFTMDTDPVKWPQTALGALMFLRGDVQAAREVVQRAMPSDWVMESLRVAMDGNHPYWMDTLPGRLALTHRTEISSFNAPALSPRAGEVTLGKERIVSDTGELTWEATPLNGRVLVDTPRHQVIIGRAGERATSNLALALTAPFAAVQLASLEERPIAEATRLLLLAGARVANTGMRWEDESRRSLGPQWGSAPTRVEPVTGSITLRRLSGAQKATLRALDAHGQPTGEGHRASVVDGSVTFVFPSDPATPWFLIEVER